MSSVAENVIDIRARVAAAARRAGRAEGEVRIIAVTKTKPAAMIREAYGAGLTDIGENYVQEAANKRAVTELALTWHMIGHLQRNKVKRAVELFDVIQTVDSLALAQALNRNAAQIGKTVSVLLEINIGAEASKSGLRAQDASRLLEQVGTLNHLTVDGLMTIPPAADAPAASRKWFGALRELRDQLAPGAPPNAPLRELSMGMSDDFEAAIAEGATIVRIGRAIFGER